MLVPRVPCTVLVVRVVAAGSSKVLARYIPVGRQVAATAAAVRMDSAILVMSRETVGFLGHSIHRSSRRRRVLRLGFVACPGSIAGVVVSRSGSGTSSAGKLLRPQEACHPQQGQHAGYEPCSSCGASRRKYHHQ
jgi:hypothetical protein